MLEQKEIKAQGILELKLLAKKAQTQPVCKCIYLKLPTIDLLNRN